MMNYNILVFNNIKILIFGIIKYKILFNLLMKIIDYLKRNKKNILIKNINGYINNNLINQKMIMTLN